MYTDLESKRTTRKEMTEKTGTVKVMRMILQQQSLVGLYSLSSSPLVSWNTYCFCCEGTEKCVACSMIRKNDTTQAKHIIAPARILARWWNVIPMESGTIAAEGHLC